MNTPLGSDCIPAWLAMDVSWLAIGVQRSDQALDQASDQASDQALDLDI
jgi:hypothetical protein